MPNLQLVAPPPAHSTYVYEVEKDYKKNQLIIRFTKGYNGAVGSYTLPVGWLVEANPIKDSPIWASIGSTKWCSNQWAPARDVGFWSRSVNIDITRNSLNNLPVKMCLGFQNPNTQAGFGLVHIYCRHRNIIGNTAKISSSDHADFVARIRNVLSTPAQAVGMRRIWRTPQRFGLMGTVSGKLYLIVADSASGSITTIFTASTSQGLSQVLGSEGFGDQSTLWKYTNRY